jgi:hypothetical protein
MKGLRAASFLAGTATTFSSAMLFCVQFPVVSRRPLRAVLRARHSRAGGTPEKAVEYWIPACAGMTGGGRLVMADSIDSHCR